MAFKHVFMIAFDADLDQQRKVPSALLFTFLPQFYVLIFPMDNLPFILIIYLKIKPYAANIQKRQEHCQSE
jgi:hypothetical protein